MEWREVSVNAKGWIYETEALTELFQTWIFVLSFFLFLQIFHWFSHWSFQKVSGTFLPSQSQDSTKKKQLNNQKTQQEHNIPQHSLITECPTRRGSRQNIIESPGAAADFIWHPFSRQDIKASDSHLAGFWYTRVYKPGVTDTSRIYSCSARWEID